MNTEKQKSVERIEDTRYSGAIPEAVLKELTPEIIDQYFIWDEVLKREIELHPGLLLPLIKEVFGKDYSAGAAIGLIATEYVVRRIHKGEGSTLNSIYADIAVQIGKRDIYHLECQMNRDKEMVVRMLEYDIHIGLVHSVRAVSGKKSSDAGMEMLMPRSVILYLNYMDNVPSKEKCLIRFADGSTYEYHVPVMKVQSYSLEMIEQKQLMILIPFLPIRFKKYLNDKVKTPIKKSVRKELTDFIRECILMVERAKENETLTQLACEDMMEFLSLTCASLLKKEPELSKEVIEIMNPTIKLPREIAAEKVQEAMKEMKKLNEEIKRVGEARRKADEEWKKVDEELRRVNEERESSIRKLIEGSQQSGQKSQEIKESIQYIFSLSEAEAEEKITEYWKN